jgi:hypothetical protein
LRFKVESKLRRRPIIQDRAVLNAFIGWSIPIKMPAIFSIDPRLLQSRWRDGVPFCTRLGLRKPVKNRRSAKCGVAVAGRRINSFATGRCLHKYRMILGNAPKPS